MARRELDDEIAIDRRCAVRKDSEAAVGHAGDCDNRALDICGVIFYVTGEHFDAKRRCSGLGRVLQIVKIGGSFWISQKCRAFSRWRNVLEHLKPFTNNARLEDHEAGDIAARTRDTRDEASTDRVDDEGEHDRDCLRRLLQGSSNWPRLCKDHFGPQCNKLPGERLHLCAGRRIAIVDVDVAVLRPSKLSQFLLERVYVRIIEADEHTDASLSKLLCTRRERPRRRAAECGQQFPPSDDDCHTPLPCEVRKGNDTTSRACSLAVQGGQDAGCFHLCRGLWPKASVHIHGVLNGRGGPPL